MGLKRSRAALAGGTMASVLGAAVGAALVVGGILGLVVFPGAPRGTGSPQPAIVLPEGGTGRAERAAARPRPAPVVPSVPAPVVADAVRPVSPAAADAVQGAVDTATGAVSQASGAL